MKKFLIASNVITLAALTYFIIKDVANPDGNGVDPDPFCGLNKNYDNEVIPGLISFSAAKEMSIDYEKDNGKKFITKNGSVTQEPDALNLRFSFHQLRSYMWQIEKRFCRVGCKLELGMRFYYAKYPNPQSTKDMGADEQYAFRHTLFMVPTYRHPKTGRHIDFDPFYTDGTNCKPHSFHSLMSTDRYQRDIMMILSTVDSVTDNHGGQCPPPSSGCTFPSPDY